MTRILAYTSFAAILSLFAASRGISQDFTEIPVGSSYPNIISAVGASADFDIDGDYDLGLIGKIDHVSGLTFSLLNDGSGSYDSAGFLPEAKELYFPPMIRVRDMDNDGDPDVVVQDLSRIVVFVNDNGTFLRKFETASYKEIFQFEIADMNKDGLPDIMFSYDVGNAFSKPNNLQLLYQQPNGNFEDSQIKFMNGFATGYSLPGIFQLGDIDKDGFIDVVFSGTHADPARFYRNLNGWAYAVVSTLSTPLEHPVLLDYDGDTHMDLLQLGSEALQLSRGHGDFTFDEAVQIETGLTAHNAVHTADINLDGLPDLILSSYYDVLLLINDGNGGYTMSSLGSPAKSIFMTDLEGDGDIDIVRLLDDTYNSNNSFYRNNNSDIYQNAPPDAPLSLAFDQADGSTRFTWNQSIDDKTPSNLLSYNVWIVDSHGKAWVHPETNSSGTFRSRIAPGNAGFDNSFAINGLPAGNYNIRVQAIDAAYALSEWSDPLDFQILPGPDNLAIERVLLNKVSLSWVSGPQPSNKVLVERKTSTSDFELIAELEPNISVYIDSGLQYDILYTYRVAELIGDTRTSNSNLSNWLPTILIPEVTEMPNIHGTFTIGNLTGDSRMDILLSGGRIFNGYYVEKVKAIFENTGSSWTPRDVGSTAPPQSSRMSFFDFNGDNSLDIYEINQTNVHVFENNGDDTFSELENTFTDGYYRVIDWWDYDMDNDLDAVVLGGNTQTILKNYGDGNFEVDNFWTLTCQFACTFKVVVGDFDKDGDEDVFRFEDNGYRLYLNSVNGLVKSNLFLSIGNYGSLTPVDYNGDGWLDLLFTSSSSYDYQPSILYKNLGINPATRLISFGSVNKNLPHGSVSSSWIDYDHDGDLDLFFTGYPSIIYNNEGNDTFRSSIAGQKFIVGLAGWIDFDDDGDMDLYVSGDSANYGLDVPFSSVLSNQLIKDGNGIKNAPPLPPTDLVAYEDEFGMHLEWQSGEDDHTPAAALTYDVVIMKDGKRISKWPIYDNGMRSILSRGRTSNFLVLNNLEIGDYTWKVQAIDQSYLGSAFSSEGTFKFLPLPPSMPKGSTDTLVYRCGREVTIRARGQNVEWFSDEEAQNSIATGEYYHPIESEEVFVTQTVDGIRSAVKRVKITIIERPPEPTIVGGNPVGYCEYAAGKPLYIQAVGTQIRWWNDMSRAILLGTDSVFVVRAEPVTIVVSQTIQSCESKLMDVVIKPVVIDSRFYYTNEYIATYEQEGDYYQWYYNNTPVPGSNTYYIDNSKLGTYKVYIEKGNCSEFSESHLITNTEDGSTNSFSAYPNPVKDELIITTPKTFDGMITVNDVVGHTIFAAKSQDMPGQDLIVSTTDWTKGVYIILFHTTSGTNRIKIVKY